MRYRVFSTLIISAILWISRRTDAFSYPQGTSNESPTGSSHELMELLSSSETSQSPTESDFSVAYYLEQVAHLIHSASLSDFITYRESQLSLPSFLDWSSDGCSKSPDRPFGHDFLSCCIRHDFAYRNYRKHGRLSSSERARIDRRFREDLYNVCSASKSFKGTVCRRLADTYYTITRVLGSGWI